MLAAALSLALAGLAHQAVADPGQSEGRGSVRVLVGFKAGASAAARAAAIAQHGGRVEVDLDEVHVKAVTLPRAAVAALARNPHVEFVEDDAPRHAKALTSPSAPPYQPGQTEAYGIRLVQADQLPDTYADSRTLCIVDSGYDLRHEDLAANKVSGRNWTRSGEWYTDEVRHGTHVGGIVSALDNPGVGVVGVMPHRQINLRIEKVFGSVGTANNSVIDRAVLDCVKQGAHVINLSLGGDTPTRTDERVFEKVVAANVLAVAAAGNEQIETPNITEYPAGYPGVLSVASVDQNKLRSPDSQVNDSVALAAPGVAVLSTVPMGSGREVTVSVGATSYEALPTEGSPVASASGPLADFGIGDAVDPAMAGKVCLIKRGSINFSVKVANCESSGGVAALIFNNVDGPLNATLGGAVTHIPSATVAGENGSALLASVGQPATVTVAATNYEKFSGTSMATPHVAAVAALVWSYFPGCTAQQIASSLKHSALDIGPAVGRDDETGAGLVQAKAAYDRIARLGCGR